MAATFSEAPSFYTAQRVSFLGGEGIVRSYRYEAETWTYHIEMALGSKPDCGRVGGETTVVLIETDLCAV